jgi:hypothetical protein
MMVVRGGSDVGRIGLALYPVHIRACSGLSKVYIRRMTGNELRARIDKLGLTYSEAADRLGLSLAGLNHQMRGIRPVGRQTEIILEWEEGRRSRRVTVRVRTHKISLQDPLQPQHGTTRPPQVTDDTGA